MSRQEASQRRRRGHGSDRARPLVTTDPAASPHRATVPERLTSNAADSLVLTAPILLGTTESPLNAGDAADPVSIAAMEGTAKWQSFCVVLPDGTLVW